MTFPTPGERDFLLEVSAGFVPNTLIAFTGLCSGLLITPEETWNPKGLNTMSQDCELRTVVSIESW